MSLLTMVQRAARVIGIASPTSVVGNTDNQVVQLLALAQHEGEDLASRHDWSALMKNTTWTISLAASQGALNSTIVTAGDFDSIIPETVWNRTTDLPIVEMSSQMEWQALQAIPMTGANQRYKIELGNLYLDPVPTAADTGALAYKSKHWCETSGASGLALWAADTDVGRLDERLMSLGLIWRWKQAKGLDYAQDFDVYEKRVLDAKARDGVKERLYLNAGKRGPVPGVGMKLWSPI